MSRDNPVRQSQPRQWAIAVWLLYLGGYFTVITALAGLAIAYMKRAQLAGTPYESHMISAIHTFWIGMVVALVSLALAPVGIGVFVMIALALWLMYRCVRGLARAIKGLPVSTRWL